MNDRYDLIVIGGGPVGAALTLALRASGISVAVLEARDDPAGAADPRALAVSWGSRLLLDRLGVWARIPATAIGIIHVSTKGSVGRSVLTAQETGVPALGYVVSYRDLYRALHEALADSEATYLTGAVVTEVRCDAEAGRISFRRAGAEQQASARLVVLADGGRLAQAIPGVGRSEREYGQWAVVAEVRADRAHGNTAYERFTPSGPLALLPQGEAYALVWTAPPDKAQELLALDDAAFLGRLQAHFGARAGRFVAAGPRAGFPLALRETESQGVPRLALLGNAAHTLHPVAGQGFNLGLRDAWELAELLLRRPGADPGGDDMLREFRSRRRLDTEAGILFTDSLVRVFSNADPLLAAVRGTALTILDLLPPAKRFLARRMIFGARG
ncbi:MAG TPA: FAD-dependent oxidoreductase [Burkholderiales bacterium]|nr:FAD-dependent oxidoreductase [Burkholderiales bacterium]